MSLGIKRKRSVEEDKIVKNRKPSLSSMAEIPKLLGPPDLQGSTLSLPVDNEELDGDLYAQNMLMVDGWREYNRNLIEKRVIDVHTCA